MNRRKLLQASAAIWFPSTLRAQTYPSRPIRYIVPVAAGGGSDMVARVVTERWGKAARPAASSSRTRAAAAA